MAGSGTIACGLAGLAAAHGLEVVLWARSETSRARTCAILGHAVEVVTGPSALAGATFLVEAVAEEHDAKASVLDALARISAPDAVLATTTSSLDLAELAEHIGGQERFVALHVFNPVAKMKLVELAFLPGTGAQARERTRALCAALGKEGIEVPVLPGFVVNRLLFPFLFSAVELLEQTGMDPTDLDACLRLGAGHPLGPLALLDLVGLDVSAAIGDALGVPVPARIRALVDEGALGRKTGRGLHLHE